MIPLFVERRDNAAEAFNVMKVRKERRAINIGGGGCAVAGVTIRHDPRQNRSRRGATPCGRLDFDRWPTVTPDLESVKTFVPPNLTDPNQAHNDTPISPAPRADEKKSDED